MARYCFYCGRALSSGEKCNCRATGTFSSASNAQASGNTGQSSTGSNAGQAPHQQAGATTGNKTSAKTGARTGSSRPSGNGSVFKRFFQAFNPFDSTSQTVRQKTNRQQSQQKSQASARRSGNQAGHGGFQFNPRSLLPELRRLGTYLIKPADSARQAAQSGSRQTVLVILILQGILGGFFLLTASSQTILRSLLDLSVSLSNQNSSFSSKLFIFVQGFGMCLAANLLLTLAYQLALRYLFHLKISYMRVLTALSPSCLYFMLFLLAGLLSLPASFFSALMMLIAGIAVATLAQFLALCALSGFDDNRNFVLVTLVMLIFTGVLAMLLNLSLPLLQALLNQSAII